MSSKRERSIAKRATAKPKSHAEIKKSIGDVSTGGAHCHWLDHNNPSFTEQGGYHDHVFVIGGKLVRTAWDGPHRHYVTDGQMGGQIQPHAHDLMFDNNLYFLDKGGEHSHAQNLSKLTSDPCGPCVDMVYDGEHRHTVEIDGVTYESLTPADVISADIRKSLNLGIQSVLFSKDRFLTWEKALQKAEELGLELKKFEERQGAFVFTQKDHSKFKELSLQTIDLEDGIQAVIGVLDLEVTQTPAVTLTPSAVSDGPVKVSAAPAPSNQTEVAAFAEVQQAQTLGYVMMSAEEAAQLGDLKDEFAKDVQALKQVAETIVEPATKFLDSWISKADENHGVIGLLDRVMTGIVLVDEALSQVNLEVEVELEKDLKAEISVIENNDQLKEALEVLAGVLAPVTKLFEDTSFERFHKLTKATGLSIARLLKQNLAIDKALIPMEDMSRDELRFAQEFRAKTWGIEVVPGSALVFPTGFPTDLNDYGDPVNLKFPFNSDEAARSARARFKQFADQLYTKDDSKMMVHNRIVMRELELGMTVVIDETDPLDMLLSDMFWEAEGVQILTAEDKPVEKNWFVPILKTAAEERTVFGIVLEPDVTDLHKDTYDEEAVVKAAHHFMEHMQNMGKMHTTIINDDVKILESYCAPVDMNLETPGGKVKVRKNTWLMKVRLVSDELWAQVKSGELTGFSIGALAQVTDLKG